MANTHFQSNNGVIVIDNTTISAPSNILIKGTNQAPERKNLFSKSLFEGDLNAINIVDGGSSADFLQHYGPIILFTNKGSDKTSTVIVRCSNVKEWIKPNTVYTLTFKINKVQNLKDSVSLSMFNGTSRMSIDSSTVGLFSATGTISQGQYDTGWANLMALNIPTSNISETGKCKEVLVEIELISFELGDHTNDPLLYMPETLYENSIISNIKETPIISSNT